MTSLKLVAVMQILAVLLVSATPGNVRGGELVKQSAVSFSHEPALLLTTSARSQIRWPKFHDVVNWLKRRFSKVEELQKASHRCSMGAEERCPMTNMKRANVSEKHREKTRIWPKGRTRCIDNSDYFFEVLPGDRDKLAFYFQGGGACWNLPSISDSHDAAFHLCKESARGGHLADEVASQRLKDYTIVEVMYCSGDAHVGARDGFFGQDVAPQRGYHNALAAFAWAKENVAPKLSSLVIFGSSAGALGATASARKILSSFSHSKASVIMDSYVWIFPERTQGKKYRKWGLCDQDLLTLDDAKRCKNSTLDFTIQDVTENLIRRFPHVNFAHITSKQDHVQRGFYDAVLGGETSYEGRSRWMYFLVNSPEFYVLVNHVLERYNKYRNHAALIIDGSQQMFLGGKIASQPFYHVPGLMSWFGDVIGHAPLHNECSGKRVYGWPWNVDAERYWETVMNQHRLFGKQDWCDARLDEQRSVQSVLPLTLDRSSV